jgi:predicted enzyme related to lactoylglutathione lyase
VTDLDEGEAFWSAVSGLSPQGRQGGEFSILDADEGAEGGGWILLQLVPAGQVSANAGTHLDFRVDDVAAAARQIEEIGGATIRPLTSGATFGSRHWLRPAHASWST